ncbi:hypothetical protein B0H13DRAFT_1858491 [Mycena leptocephala]|nr:hypothetical protein B0H13DRAFT_1858491 [Mycena leptocephala]
MCITTAGLATNTHEVLEELLGVGGMCWCGLHISGEEEKRWGCGALDAGLPFAHLGFEAQAAPAGMRALICRGWLRASGAGEGASPSEAGGVHACGMEKGAAVWAVECGSTGFKTRGDEWGGRRREESTTVENTPLVLHGDYYWWILVPKSDASTPTPRKFKKGLNIALKDSVQKRKDGLVARLNRKKIFAVDWLRMNHEAWLDNDTSHIEEDWSAGQPDCDVAQRGHSPSAGVEEGYVTALNSE